MSSGDVPAWQRRALVGASLALALASGAFLVSGARGARWPGGPPASMVAVGLTVLALAAVLPRRRAAPRARLLLGLLTIGLAGGGFLLHSQARQARRSAAESTRTALAGRPAPPLRYAHALNLPGAGKDLPAAGRVTILDFWATWCPPCRTQMPHLERAFRERGGRGLDVVGVTTFYEGESAEERREELRGIESFVRELGISYPIVVAETTSSHDAYGIFALPAAVLVDRDGTVLEYAIGADQAEALSRRAIERLESGSRATPLP